MGLQRINRPRSPRPISMAGTPMPHPARRIPSINRLYPKGQCRKVTGKAPRAEPCTGNRCGSMLRRTEIVVPGRCKRRAGEPTANSILCNSRSPNRTATMGNNNRGRITTDPMPLSRGSPPTIPVPISTATGDGCQEGIARPERREASDAASVDASGKRTIRIISHQSRPTCLPPGLFAQPCCMDHGCALPFFQDIKSCLPGLATAQSRSRAFFNSNFISEMV